MRPPVAISVRVGRWPARKRFGVRLSFFLFAAEKQNAASQPETRH
jgi:hypothetical protein